MKKLNFGCGPNKLEGWENYDLELDITKTLPFSSDSVDFIFIEHAIEHVLSKQVFYFLCECRRILKARGTVRVSFPDIFRICTHENSKDYVVWLKRNNFSEKETLSSALTAVITNYGHQSIWCHDSMFATMIAAGLTPVDAQVSSSTHPELYGIEGHGKIIGNEEIMRIETTVIEGSKVI